MRTKTIKQAVAVTAVTSTEPQQKQKDSQQRATLDIGEVTLLLGIGRNQVYSAARNGQLPTIRIGGRILVSRVVLERMLEGGAIVAPSVNLQ